jgi:hypothetical protein
MAHDNITLANKLVGSVEVEQRNQIYANGYPYNTCLWVPITVTMQPRPEDQVLVMTELTCSLLAENQQQIGAPVTKNLLDGMYCRSCDQNSNSHTIFFGFPLDALSIDFIEKQRHLQTDHDFVGKLRFQAIIAQRIQVGTNTDYFVLAPYLHYRIDDVSLRIANSDWVKRVLNNLGLNQFRIIEVELPKKDGDFPGRVFTHLQAAQQHLDLGNYRDCIKSCRDVRYAVEEYLGATKAKDNDVASITVKRLGLAENSFQENYLRSMWASLAYATNDANHELDILRFTRADAHACLLLATNLLEYLNLAR